MRTIAPSETGVRLAAACRAPTCRAPTCRAPTCRAHLRTPRTRLGAASFAKRARGAAFRAGLLLALGLGGCFSGKGTIGAVIAQDDSSGRLFIRDVPPGLAAAGAHLQAGDEILLIDGLDVRFMDAKQIHEALVGEVDSKVKLTLVRDEAVLRVTLSRTEAKKALRPAAKRAE